MMIVRASPTLRHALPRQLAAAATTCSAASRGTRSVFRASHPLPLTNINHHRSIAYPLLAVGVGLFTVNQIHTSTTTSAATTTTSTTTTPSAPSPPCTLDYSRLPYTSAADFRARANVVLYLYQTCPFCNKVRTYLDFQQIPYTMVEVDPMKKTQIKQFTSQGVPEKVPIVTVDSQVLHDSTPIIDALQSLLARYDPITYAISVDEQKYRMWVDENLFKVTAVNLYTSLTDSIQAMNYISSQTDLSTGSKLAAKYIGGPAMYFVSKKLLKKYNIDNPRQSLYTVCHEWTNSALNHNNKPFHGGNKPDLADVAAFGVLRSFLGFPAGVDMLNPSNTSQSFVDWFQRMRARIKSAAKNPGRSGVAAEYTTA